MKIPGNGSAQTADTFSKESRLLHPARPATMSRGISCLMSLLHIKGRISIFFADCRCFWCAVCILSERNECGFAHFRYEEDHFASWQTAAFVLSFNTGRKREAGFYVLENDKSATEKR